MHVLELVLGYLEAVGCQAAWSCGNRGPFCHDVMGDCMSDGLIWSRWAKHGREFVGDGLPRRARFRSWKSKTKRRCLRHHHLDTQLRLGVKKLVSPQVHGQCESPKKVCSYDRLPNIRDNENPAECPAESDVQRQGPFSVRFDRGSVNSLERWGLLAAPAVLQRRRYHAYLGPGIYQEADLCVAFRNVEKAAWSWAFDAVGLQRVPMSFPEKLHGGRHVLACAPYLWWYQHTLGWGDPALD